MGVVVQSVVRGGAGSIYYAITRGHDSKSEPTSGNATNCENVIAGGRNGTPVLRQADTAINRGVVIGALAVIVGLAHEATTGGNDRRSEPTSGNATNFENVIAGGRNETPVLLQANTVLGLDCMIWVILGLAALVGFVGKLCYDAYTSGNDRRAKIKNIEATEEAKQKRKRKR